MSDEAASPLAFRARWIVPIASPPIRDGYVGVQNGRITGVGIRKPDGPIKDLGEVAVLPGWVNAHTHLEFSHLRQPLGKPGIALPDWIGLAIASRISNDDRERAIADGLAELARCDTALVGEIATTPWCRPHEPNVPTVIAMAEVLGLESSRADLTFDLAASHWRANQPDAGISPHAPYSTPVVLVDRCVEFSGANDCPLAMHVAESPAERELLRRGTGPFADALRCLNLWPDQCFPWNESEPYIHLIRKLSRARRAMLVHGNDFRSNEIQELANHRTLSVVFCPRTHAFFGYDSHPVDKLLRAGVNVGLGTDSRASNPDLNLFGEVEHLLHHRQDLEPARVFEMATRAGAIALGREKDFGTLETGKQARFACVPTIYFES